MKVGNTSTGAAIFFDTDSEDVAEIKFPRINQVYDITEDLVNTGNPLMIQESSNTVTPVRNYAGKTFFNFDGDVNGNGSITVTKNSDADRIFLSAYNGVLKAHTDKNLSLTDKANLTNNLSFDIYIYDATTLDNGGNPQKWAIAEGCYFNKEPATNPGASNANGTQWVFSAQHIKHVEGKPTPEAYYNNSPAYIANEQVYSNLHSREMAEDSESEVVLQSEEASMSASNSRAWSSFNSASASQSASYKSSLDSYNSSIHSAESRNASIANQNNHY